MRKMLHIGISGPIYIPTLASILENYKEDWPKGMGGSPVNNQIISLINLGYKVSVFSSSPEIKESFEIHQDNLSIYIGPYRKRARYRMFDLFKVEREYITKKINIAKPDIIHAHWQYEWSWASLNSNVKTLVTCHDAPLEVLKNQTNFYRLIRLIMSIIVIKKASFLTTVSPYCKDELRLLTKKNIKVIPNFELDFVFDLYEGPRSLGKEINIVMINNGFTKRKNVIRGIKSFVDFNKKYTNSYLHLYGIDHGYHEKAEKWCKVNSIETSKIHFHGEIAFFDLMKELSKMTILLHTSLEESFGMILVEAMAMGIPVIAGHNSGGPEWILKDGGGILVNTNSNESITNGIIHLCRQNYYTVTSETAHNVAKKRFSERKIMEQYLEILNLINEQ